MDLSVIIPCRNGVDTLDEQLDALEQQAWNGDWEVVVVDNGSTDGTPELVKRRMESTPNLRLVQASERAGIGYARNRGVDATDSPKILLCDADDIVHPGWVAALAAGLDQYPVVSGALDVDSLNTSELAASRGPGESTPTFYDIFPAVHGCSVGFRRDAFDAIDGFREDWPWPTEDKKFSFDAALNGLEVGFVPEAVVGYRYRTDSKNLWRQGCNYGNGRVMVAADVRDHGWPTPPKFVGWRSWLWMIRHLPDLFSADRRSAWVWVAANRIGHLQGSIRYRLVLL